MLRVCLLVVCPFVWSSLPVARLHASAFEEIAADAEAARGAHDVPRAIELYRTALSLRADWQGGWWYLGTLLYGSKQYGSAQDAIGHVTRLNPDAGPAWGLLGLCESEIGDYPAALAHVQKSLALGAGSQPDLGDVLRSSEAMLLTRNGQFDKAFERYVQFLRAGAPSEPLLAALGLAVLRRPLLPKEIPATQQDLIVRAGRASFATISGESKTACKSLRELAESFPSEPGVHYLYASWLIRSNERRAIDELNRELSIVPGSAPANQMLSWILLGRGDVTGALLHAETAARVDSASPIAQLVLGRALAKSGDVKDGIRHIEMSATIDPNNLETRIALEGAYEQAGLYRDARRERQEALRMKEAAHGAAN